MNVENKVYSGCMSNLGAKNSETHSSQFLGDNYLMRSIETFQVYLGSLGMNYLLLPLYLGCHN